ncbi:hypothetical protein AV955_gp104 [Diadromus pulchellus ascovirus 4a]|uniref:Complete DpAV4 genome n=1 Tax=Diadromus pulchellus ascovirus 4a TaxID=158683 RepID=F2NZ33_9VIRU|nr:hypothetical protein AV955_gp104 [Diadromus pulchellus ascovirus 4a]CCA61461.1 unnamed protein product [Diadromus pulchellus ascovirus 4a]
MLVYLEDKNFNIKNKTVHTEVKNGVFILCIVSKTCSACSRAKSMLELLSDREKRVTFGVVDIDQYPRVVDIFRDAGLAVTHTPFFAVFKMGIFIKTIKSHSMSSGVIESELEVELSDRFSALTDDDGW